MLIRNRKVIQKTIRKHASARVPLAHWLEIAEVAEWRSIIDARSVWPATDAVKGTPLTCFNIGGNSFRLLAIMSYRRQEIVIDEVLTHAEYDKKYRKLQVSFMNKAKTNRPTADDYLELVRRFPLRPIHSDAEYDRAIEILKGLVAQADAGLTSGERDYTDALGHFVGTYEDAHYKIEQELKTPIERLKYLLEQQGMSTTDLGKLLGSGAGQASLILNGKRELSKANIRTLADRFKISPALFL